MRFTRVDARNEFQTYAIGIIEDTTKIIKEQVRKHMQLYRRYEEENPGLAEINKNRADIETLCLVNIINIWSESHYTQLEYLTFQDWLKQKYPVVYQQDFPTLSPSENTDESF